ncbi:MAG TPA: Spy/CpxP family protein refolding chaperone [Terriglobales bacterium]|nr:Spy/CpxP family protein refolding chaperone [Terriglobales bacterium]
MKIPWLIPMLVVVTMTTLALAQADDSNPNRSDQGSEDTLVVAPPGSSPKIPESLAKYLELTPVQIATIEARIAEEQRQTQPLLQQLSHNREALTTATHTKQSTNINRHIRRLDVEQSHILERLVDANLRLQRDIYKILTDAQRERLDDIGQHIADVIQQWFVGR